MTRFRGAVALLAGLLCLAPLTSASPAHAATCTDGRGVSVVVDFGDLGGGVHEGCAGDGGGENAASIFSAAGITLTYAQRAAGFVCRVNGVPTSDPCMNASPADAYWGLWWSDGRTGRWVYSSAGSSSLTVPAGGSVAFAWNSGTRTEPAATPPVVSTQAAPAPPSSPRATPSNGSRPAPGTDAAPPPVAPTRAAGTASAAATPGAEPTRTPTRAPRRTTDPATASPSAAPATPGADAADETTEASEESATSTDDGGLPGWVVAAVLVLVFGGAGVVAVRRRGAARP